MKNHLLKLFIFTLFFGLVTSASEFDEDSETPAPDDVVMAAEPPAATPDSQDGFGADFQDFNPEDSINLSLDTEAMRAGYQFEDSFPANGAIIPPGYEAADDMYQSGYTASGMDPLLAGSLIANSHVDALFKKYASLRSQKGITLPEEFRELVSFVMGYIKIHADKDAEAENGMSHWALAVQIVKASFCFGNDPFMLAAKIRRETSFNRTLVSSGSAVGFSQMTGSGINEVKDQMSGNPNPRKLISMPNALRSFQMGVRCYAGIDNFRLPALNNTDMKKELRSRYRLDLTFGQIMMKAYVSYAKATSRLSNSVGDIAAAYGSAFVMYNGDSTPTRGACLGVKSTEMKLEYSCDIMKSFNTMSGNWNNYLAQKRKRERQKQLY